MTRKAVGRGLADAILIAARHRCCVCPQHRRISNIHHIDEDNSNNSPHNLIGLCSECHADAHTRSAMRRSITSNQLLAYKMAWEERCSTVPPLLPIEVMRSCYYVNIDRLTPTYKQITGLGLASNAPHWFGQKADSYDTLWANKRNSLNWQQLLSLREYLDDSISKISASIAPLDVGLFEYQAADPREWQGEFVTFNCDFRGCDIPDQGQLEATNGDLDGPPPTLRREHISDEDDEVFEICMMLTPRFFYSDSAFIQFSETSRWSGVGICGLLREAVGSNDGHRLRSQLLITPLWIGRGAESTVLARTQ